MSSSPDPSTTPFSITKHDVGRYVRCKIDGCVGRIQRDPGNGHLYPSLKYEWEWCCHDFEYVVVMTDSSGSRQHG